MFEQYLSIKEEYPDCLLFYRMGDFYEMFFEDAEIAARELQITLTSRNKQAENPVPMCGMPYHSYEGYVAKLLAKGFKIAVCNQVEDPREAKGLVKREVTQVLTPGTVVEDQNLSSQAANYLAAIFFDKDKGAGGLAWADISTGEWSGLFATREDQLWQWLLKIGPSEVLIPHEHDIPKEYAGFEARTNRLPIRSHFDLTAAERNLCEAQGVANLEALDLADKPQLAQACGAILAYLRQTQKSQDVPLAPFKPLNLSRHLLLDEVSERNLEIFHRLDGGRGRGTLWSVINQTMTPMGARLLAERLRNPWKDIVPIAKTLDAVALFVEQEDLREELRTLLGQVYDVERLATRIFLNRATPKDFIALRESLTAVPQVKALLARAAGDAELPAAPKQLLSGWDGLEDYAELLTRALADSPPHLITEGGLFKRGYHPELDELMDLTDDGEARIKELLEAERAATGLDKLRLGFNKVFGYYFELSKAQMDKAPYHFERKQTLVNAERFITPQLKELEDRILHASDKRKDLEYKLFGELRESVASARHRFMDMAQRLAALDYWQGLAHAARRHDWTRPELTGDLDISIKSGRHPVVEAVQGAGGYIPNDLNLTADKRVLLITGPNMAGKSTVLRQVAIIAIMAQIGSFVPAASATLGLTDRIFSRVGASDNLAQGQSTFMVEMMETARILRQAGKRSLVILDEIGRGTSTFDGLALAWAVVEELAARGDGGVRTLFATHFHELTVLEGQIPAVANFNIAVKEYRGDIVFLRRMVPGPSDRSYGIEVAKLAGVPRSVVSRAKEILTDLEARAGGTRSLMALRAPAQQSMLPGLGAPSACPAPQAELPPEIKAFAEELGSLEVDRLTPIEALNFLHTWKSMNLKKD
ncbi:MAG: DNA mismatch repair protein MutS [Proteobacteria bacterium]|nr:DNA mismatch repair protein MutS [Pseudomonadota bacterium]